MQAHIADDDALLAALKQDSEAAFTRIYEQYHKLLYALALRYLKCNEPAEDAVQQVFLKLWEARQLLPASANLRNYLYTMLKNGVLNEIRNQTSAMEKNYELAQAAPAYEEELLAKLEERELRTAVYRAIGQLPEQKRLVCLYKLQGGLSNQEIADKMHLSVPTVKTHYAQAIKLLRERLGRLFPLFFYLIDSFS